MRTVAEIASYLGTVLKERDQLGLAAGDLSQYLPGDTQKPLPTEEEIKAMIVDYLPFAFGKAIDHRGLSADRSVNHLANWAWLMGRDDLVSFADNHANYRSYGVPVLKRFAREFGVALPPEIERWPDGEPCNPDCEMGC